MVRWLALLLLFSSYAHALLPQTQADLSALADRLRYEFGAERDRRPDRDAYAVITPILVATPLAHWQESKSDFGPAVMNVLAGVFPNPGDLIACAQCYQSRVYVSHDSRTVVQNGELSLVDLARLREQPGYGQAKSVLITRETPSGIQLQVLAIDDGRILYTGLVDATKTLDKAEPPMRLARELDRRERGEALGYINVDLGVYPQGKFQLKFLEQWGNHNQHLSGFVLSAYNPTGAIGGTYLYMLPYRRQITVGTTLYYSLEGMFDGGSKSLGKSLTGQLSLNYAISGSYGLFLAGDTDGKISLGFSLLNPVLFPFLL